MRFVFACLMLVGCLPEEATDPVFRAAQDAAPTDAAPTDAAPDAMVADAAPADAAPADAAPGADAFTPVVDLACPGSPSCALGPAAGLEAGAAALPFSDIGFERPRPEFLKPNECNELQPGGRCGELIDAALDNCGTDGLCLGDDAYPGPDADGSEGDLTPAGDPAYDYFFDCGLDALCPGDDGYVAPDEGEGDQIFQGLWIAGFGTNRPAAGVRDHAWARTVALRQGETLVTLTALDAVGLFHDDVVRIRERVYTLLAAEAPGLDIDAIIVSSTHSHEVPDTMGQWGGEARRVPTKTGVDPRYIERLRSQAARSIVDAVLDLRPARLVVGATATGIEGFIRDSRPPIVVDDTLGVAHLINAEERTIATLVNWGNHPEAMGSDNNLITSDFPGALRQALEDGLPAQGDAPAVPGLGGVAIFVQGMVGGLMTPLGIEVRGPDGAVLAEPSFERNDAMGHRLARMAFDALEEAEEVVAPDLKVASSLYRVAAENRFLMLAYQLGLFDRQLHDYDESFAIGPNNQAYVQTEAALVSLGPLTLYTVPGELFPELAVGGYDGSRSFGLPVIPVDDPLAPDLAAAPPPPYLHDLMPGRHRWVVGLGMDELGYMVPPYDFKLDPALPYLREAEGAHYEETNSLSPTLVPRTQAVLHALAEALAP
jgi:hypothetical protein